MAKKITKAEQKRLASAILSKAQKLWAGTFPYVAMSTKDFIKIEEIVKRTLKRIG